MGSLNLCEILKGHEGEIFYSPIFGDLIFVCVIYPCVRFKTIAGDIWDINLNGKLYNNSDELCVFPSKDQRDWNKWIEEQNSKAPKTWNEFEKQLICNSYILGKGFGEVEFTKKGDTPIEKSALALLKIYQLIEVGYGGNILPNKYNGRNTFWIILLEGVTREFKVCPNSRSRHLVSFYTRAQAEEFLKYPENVRLLKDYFMI